MLIAFMYTADYVGSRSKEKKLFTQADLPKLYWWDVYTAMQTPGKASKTFICPCRIVGTSLVLVFILKTRCNKPNYDCLVYDMDSDKAHVMRQDTKWQSTFELDVSLQDYDVDAMNS